MALWFLRVLLFCISVQFVWCKLCAPAEEGKEGFDIRFRSRDRRHVHGFVWFVQYKGRKPDEVSHCYQDETNCWDLTKDFTPESIKVGSETINKMTIEKVLPSHREMKIIICVLQGSTPKPTPIDECTMNVFKNPESAECYAEESGEHHVDVKCVAREAHPGMTCEMYQASQKPNDDKITHDMIAGESDVQHKNRVVTVGDIFYENTECSKKIFVPHVGSYQFYAKMRPGVQGMHPQYFVTASYSAVIKVTKSAVKVRILKPDRPIDVCPGYFGQPRGSLKLACEADGFDDNPDIEFTRNKYLDFHTCVLSSRKTPKGSLFRKHCKVSIQPPISLFKLSTESVTVHCSAQSDGPRGKLVKKRSRLIKLRWPRQLTPYVRYEGKPVLNGDRIQVSQEAQTYISCTIEDQQEQSTTLEVICYDELNGEIAVSEEKQNVSSIVLKFPKFEEKLKCECKAHHLAACHDRIFASSFRVINGARSLAGWTKSCLMVVSLIACFNFCLSM